MGLGEVICVIVACITLYEIVNCIANRPRQGDKK